jgi:hypothetical protein
VRHDVEVVRDEQVAQAEAALQFRQQIENLAAHRGVQRRHRFVQHDHFRLHDDTPGDRDALSLSAAEFMRIARAGFLTQSDARENIRDALVDLLAR